MVGQVVGFGNTRLYKAHYTVGEKLLLVEHYRNKKLQYGAAVEIGARLAEAPAGDEQGSDGEDVEDAILGSSMATEISELSTIFVSIEAVKEKMRTLD